LEGTSLAKAQNCSASRVTT